MVAKIIIKNNVAPLCGDLISHYNTPRVVFFDTCAQLVILRIHFTKKMGMFNSKLRKFVWQICIASGSIKEVFGENSDLITLNFNEGTDQELCVQVKCLVTNAASMSGNW
jgi:hypothetical protein